MICHKSDINSKDLVVQKLKENKVVIIPTDTVYGFSAVVFNDDNGKAVNAEKICNVKGRDENKPFIQLISSPSEIQNITNQKIPSNLLKFWPGPLTIIVKDKNNENSTIAVRCPGDQWLRNVIKECGFPLYSTSVNLSGCPILETEEEILNTFSDKVDLIVLDGDKKNGIPSTIVKIEGESFSVLRQGSIKLS